MSEVERTDNSQWMASLPEKVRREVPLMDLAIPGSHDSFTSNLTRWVPLLTGDCGHTDLTLELAELELTSPPG